MNAETHILSGLLIIGTANDSFIVQITSWGQLIGKGHEKYEKERFFFLLLKYN